MNKEDLLSKLEVLVSGMREELNKNEGSTLQTISSSMKSGYDGVKSAISGNEKAQKFLDNMKNNFDELAKTVKAGDQKLSAKTLDALDKLIREHKARETGTKENAEGAETDNAGLPMLESQPLDPAISPKNPDGTESEKKD